jgi:hypothetical protein
MRTIAVRLRRGFRCAVLCASMAAGLLAPAPYAALTSPIPAEFPVISLERVTPREGNNPFDPRDPLAPDARTAASPRR